MDLEKLDLSGLELVDETADYGGTQIIYLDFDGADGVSYDNDVLGINVDVEVSASELTEEEQFEIVSSLNEIYAGGGIYFTIEIPAEGEYSTIYAGGDGFRFSEYGTLLGLSETIDVGNLNKSDEAFVFVDNIDSISSIIEVIAHEAGHLIGYVHDDDAIVDNLYDFADVTSYDEDTLQFLPYDEIDGNYGDAFDIDDDGNVVVGAPTDTVDYEESGSVYVYRYNNGGYTEYKLTPSDAIKDGWFGYEVAIDNGTVVAGIMGYPGYKFVYNDGSVLYVSNDDYSELISDPDFISQIDWMKTEVCNVPGEVNVYRWDGDSYEEYSLSLPQHEQTSYRYSLDINDDRIVVADQPNQEIYVYDWTGSKYKQTCTLSLDAAGTWNTVAIDDFNNIATSVNLEDDGRGCIYVYRWDGSSYTGYKISAPDCIEANQSVQGDIFGYDVDIYGDTVVTCTYDYAFAYRWDGSAYVLYELDYDGDISSISIDNGIIMISGYDSEYGSITTYYTYDSYTNSYLTYTQNIIDDNLAGEVYDFALETNGVIGNNIAAAYGSGFGVYNDVKSSVFVVNLDTIFTYDSVGPGVPEGLTTRIDGDDILFDWCDSIGYGAGIDGYIVKYSQSPDLSNAVTKSMVSSELSIDGLVAGTYYWSVVAVDTEGNESEVKVGNTFTVAGPADASTPTTPKTKTLILNGTDTVTFCWSASKDNVGVSAYEICLSLNADLSGGEYQAVSGSETSYTWEGLASGQYYYAIAASDAAGNTSERSSISSFYLPPEDAGGNDFTDAASIDLSEAPVYGEYVGYGDGCDCYTFTLDRAGEFDFTLLEIDAKVKINIYAAYESKGVTKCKKVKGTSSKYNKVTEETIASLKNIILDAGTYYVEIISGDKGKGKYNTEYTLDTSSSYFPEATDNNTWQLAVKVIPDEIIDTGYVGFGDACDWYKFEVGDLTSFDLDLAGENKNAKLTVYYWDEGKNKLKKVKNTNLKSGLAAIDNLKLDVGLYYVEVLSADKGKGKYNTEYELTISAADA